MSLFSTIEDAVSIRLLCSDRIDPLAREDCASRSSSVVLRMRFRGRFSDGLIHACCCCRFVSGTRAVRIRRPHREKPKACPRA